MSKHLEDDARVLPPPLPLAPPISQRPPRRSWRLRAGSQVVQAFGDMLASHGSGKQKQRCSWAVYYSSIDDGEVFQTAEETYRYLVHQLDNNAYKSLYYWKVAKITLDKAPEITDATRWMLKFADRQYRREQAGDES